MPAARLKIDAEAIAADIPEHSRRVLATRILEDAVAELGVHEGRIPVSSTLEACQQVLQRVEVHLEQAHRDRDEMMAWRSKVSSAIEVSPDGLVDLIRSAAGVVPTKTWAAIGLALLGALLAGAGIQIDIAGLLGAGTGEP